MNIRLIFSSASTSPIYYAQTFIHRHRASERRTRQAIRHIMHIKLFICVCVPMYVKNVPLLCNQPHIGVEIYTGIQSTQCVIYNMPNRFFYAFTLKRCNNCQIHFDWRMWNRLNVYKIYVSILLRIYSHFAF